MSKLLDSLKNLITLDEISELSAEDIIGQISLRLYEQENQHIRDNDMFLALPTVLRDIILIIDLDTEVSMEGILGFLENSTGLFLDDTILTLERIKANEDCLVMSNIRDILKKYNVSTYDLRDNVNRGNLYDITSFSKTHGSQYDEMADTISVEAEKLYLYRESGNIFDYLIEYVEENKKLLYDSLIEL
jgi:hypothetical protein